MTVTIGLWRCLAPKGCTLSATHGTFEGPTHAEARERGEPVRCPECGGAFIIYDSENIKEAEHAA